MIVERQIQVNVSLLLLIRYYNPNDTDDDDTDDSGVIYFGKSRCGTDIKIKIVGKCLMDKKKVVSLLNGFI